MGSRTLPTKIRVSTGSAIALCLEKGIVDAEPTTIYLLTYRLRKCSASCAFCPQSRKSSARADMLSRITWPIFRSETVIQRIGEVSQGERIKRICIQALNYPTVGEDLVRLVKSIRSVSQVPVSVSCQPLDRECMTRLAKAGVNRVSIALDAVTEEIFRSLKGASSDGPYTWTDHMFSLKCAVETFGRGSVTTHLIAGLGEKEEDFISMIQKCVDMGVYPAIFAFTPIPGTAMENHSPPLIDYYRRIQLAQYLITNGVIRYEETRFRNGCAIDLGISKKDLREIVRTGEPFKTSGCPYCNRPYYNERPGGQIYNYPRELTREETKEIEAQMASLLEG